MKKFIFAVIVAACSALVGLSGCSSKASSNAPASKDPGRPAASAAARADRQYGVIESISSDKSDVNAGTFIGGAAGGLAGHQVGGGSGQTLATIAGALGGAVVGTKVANRNQVYTIIVKLADGEVVTVKQKASLADVKVGERVRLIGDHVYPA